MTTKGIYNDLGREYPEIQRVVKNLGKTVREAGPLGAKESQLIQLAAAAAIASEGSVHSHTRRAFEAGANRKEIDHALLLLISTIGFPKTMMALSWSRDIEG
ncbi:carboxymuconolactone decarboxylase family protein [Desulforhopalus vacuolatus]|uniref:carboxymuconolactone decarboxylase family protein n=1 Tax=Desulforhopalus vacuolatus TaxID=40414 RepID=UPI0019646AEA|nr:carboxymuconolactone decarboxylase family protein [Desulforhopalus vacuolatus]MBM9518973.1 carboxymuconolactone decarboxylase family protein [Desulforhopalus vacuolatus]